VHFVVCAAYARGPVCQTPTTLFGVAGLQALSIRHSPSVTNKSSTPSSSALDDAAPRRARDRRRMQSKHNWVWALVALAVWVSIFFAFLLIAIPRH
jgi:hypothetical protein